MHQFEVSFDSKARAAYLRFSKEKIAKSAEHANGDLVFDFDYQGHLVGIEILSPGILNILFHPTAGQPQLPDIPHLNDREIEKIERLFEVA